MPRRAHHKPPKSLKSRKPTQDYPAPQYKYLHRVHAEALVNEGIIKIGTFYDFRQHEAHDPAVGDASEGEYTEYSDDTVEWADHKDAPDFYKRVLGKPLRDHLRFEGIRFQQKHRVTDAYMFCTSREFSVEIMQKSPYNACVRIDDPIRFVGHVTAHLRNEITATVVGRCVYMEKMIYHRLPRRPHPGFVKDKEYEFWKELRAVWVPEALKIEPRIETIPELCTTCSLYHVAEDSQ